MRQLLLCLLFSTSTLCLLAQDHQTNKKSLSRHLRAVYDVTKTDWKVKDGSYTVINDAGSPVVKGAYAKGKKTGIWTYYDNNGKLVQQYDYNHDSLLIDASDAASVVHADFQIPQTTEDTSKIQKPFKIGGPEYGFYLLYDDRDIPAAIKASGSKAEMTYVLTIDEHGKLESYMVMFVSPSVENVIVHHSVKGLSDEAMEYNCAMIDGKPVRSKISYTIPLDINHTTVPGENYHPAN